MSFSRSPNPMAFRPSNWAPVYSPTPPPSQYSVREVSGVFECSEIAPAVESDATDNITEATPPGAVYGSLPLLGSEHVAQADSEDEDADRLKHHSNYYFDDGMIIFLVGKRYFKVPRVRLEQNSQVLKKHLQDLGVGSAFGPGHSDEQPVILEDVKSKDFARLLSFLYPLTNRYKTFTDSWSHDTWMSILSVTHKYEMREIQALAIERLTESDRFKTHIDKICSGEKFGHIAWVKTGYEELIKRQEMLTIEEAKIIGLENSIRCARAREEYRDRINSHKYPQYHNRGPLAPSVSAPISREILNKHFSHL